LTVSGRGAAEGGLPAGDGGLCDVACGRGFDAAA